MKIPSEIFNQQEWTLVGPMGPKLDNSRLLSLPIICVDGGAHFLDQALIWIGDSDSSESKIEAKYYFDLNPKKDVSDLRAAFDLFPPQLAFKLHLWGFMGGRQDHHLINLGETYKTLKLRAGSIANLYDQNRKLSMIMTSQKSFNLRHHGVFSLICFETTTIELRGDCDFQLNLPTVIGPLSSHGLSNKAAGEMTIISDNPILIVLEEE